LIPLQKIAVAGMRENHHPRLRLVVDTAHDAMRFSAPRGRD